MRFYCTNCWNDITENDKICSHCGADQTELHGEVFEEKLIRALHNPEPETVIRAANILADLKVLDALPSLESLIKINPDPFILAAAIKSICKIGGENYFYRARNLLKSKKSFIVENALKDCQSFLKLYKSK